MVPQNQRQMTSMPPMYFCSTSGIFTLPSFS